MEIFLVIIALIWLLAATIQDFKKREIPNWLSFSLVIIGLSYWAFYSAIFFDLRPFLYGFFGFAIFFGLAELFYYSRVFAGGDAKLMMALGPILVSSSSFWGNIIFFGVFILLLLFVGGFYGLIYSLVLVFFDLKRFVKEFPRQFEKNIKISAFSLFLFTLSLIIAFYFKERLFYVFPVVFFLFPFLYVFAKTIEESFFIVSIDPKKVTAGDWLYKKVKVGKRIIKPDWEGLNEEEVLLLRRYKGKIKIKQGIPFALSFLIGFVVLVLIEMRLGV